MKLLPRVMSVIGALVFLPLTISGVGALAHSEKEVVWCNVDGTDFQTGGRRSYFSEVFYGNPDEVAEGNYSQAFRNYVAANYARVLGLVSCSGSDEMGEARSNRDAAKAGSMYPVIETGWTYQ